MIVSTRGSRSVSKIHLQPLLASARSIFPCERKLIPECVEFLDAQTMKAINQGGLTGKTYKEVDTLFFKFQG